MVIIYLAIGFSSEWELNISWAQMGGTQQCSGAALLLVFLLKYKWEKNQADTIMSDFFLWGYQ